MKRFSIILIMCCLALGCWAQTQRGFVKTLGRPDKKGVALSGVSVRVKGGHNAVLSKDDGTFSMLMTGKKVGDAYSLQQVQKDGYELNEIGVIGRQYAFSDRAPLTIVMVSTSQLQADKQRIENNAYKAAEKNYRARLAQLEKDKDSGIITIEAYRQELQDLQDKFEKYQSLIDGLAEHYAHTDYDGLNEKEREINICIENGDLERADSLIRTIFDPIDVLKRNKEAIARIEQQESQAHSILAQANADMARVLKQQEKDAEYLYQLYTIALGRFDNESARKYIETRAELDTTNCKWQFNAGEFILMLSDINRAIAFLNRSLRYSGSKPEYHSYRWQCYHHLGHLYSKKNLFLDALDYFKKALDDDYVKSGDDISCKALLYTSFTSLYREMGDYTNAMEYIQKTICLKDSFDSPGLDSIRVFHSVVVAITNLAGIYSDMGKYEEASKFYKQAMQFTTVKYHLGTLYNNYGVLLRRQKKYDEALEIYKKALDIDLEIYGNNHPSVGRVYGNIGNIYMETKRYAEAENYLLKSIQILGAVYGPNNTLVAGSYSNMGALEAFQEKWQDAITYYRKALDLLLGLIGDSHPQTALAYQGLGFCYAKSGDTEKGIQFLEKALTIMKEKMGENHPYIKDIENDILEVKKKH